MRPILFELPGGIPLRSFGVMAALGFLVSAWALSAIVRRHSPDPESEGPRYAQAPVWVMVGVMIGARILYVVVELLRGSATGQAYLEEPWRVFAIWEGGLVMYGGLFGGLLAGWACCQRYQLPTWRATDLGLTAGFFGLATGRIGCLLVGDDYGRIVPEGWEGVLPWLVTLHVPQELPPQSLFGAENAGQWLWATQTWMAINALGIGLLGLFLIPRRRFGGQVALVLVLVYAVNRSIIEGFRGDAVRGKWFGDAVSTSQLISLVAGAVALALLVRHRRRRDPELVRAAQRAT